MADSDYVISIQPGYVLVEDPPDYDVVWTEQPAKLQAISAVCNEADCRKVLIRGTTSRMKMTFLEINALGKAVAELYLMIAVVTQHDVSKQDVLFLENVARNRGSPVQFFDNEQAAKDWLGV